MLSKPIMANASAWFKPTLGFQSLKTAHATLKGFEVMWGAEETAGPGFLDPGQHPE